MTTMDTADIAAFLRRNRKHVTDRITKAPDFPKPVIDRGKRLRFWRKEDVEAWARGKQCAS
jgi:predicted DNA-binding transcriptional regulator AlpA